MVGYALTEQQGTMVAWVLNMSRQKELEAKLLQTQKMEAVGELAGGIAHDFNNLMMVISSHAELIAGRATENGGISKSAATILSSTEHASQLTRRLLAFSRKQELVISPFDVNELLSESVELVSHLLPKNIEFQVHRAAHSCFVMADRAQLQQVILNLIINARDAMPEGGKLVVRASGVAVGDDDIGLHGAVPTGEYALISVADTGHGIPKHILGKIFDPFFTTKPKGRGTGLGLAMAYGIVTQSGGHIRVKSDVGVGTTISVYLPSTENQVAEPSRSADCPFRRADRSACPAHGTVLVVDDEDFVRSSVRAFLKSKGLNVVDTGDPSEAIRLAKELGDELSTLVTDVVMPEMTGVELTRTLHARRDSLSVVFMSGYAAGVNPQKEFPHAKFLQKPFTRATLIEAVCASSRCKKLSSGEKRINR
jgi:two-component system, cell cycle sensor histidine kinase and response regulator CckA